MFSDDGLPSLGHSSMSLYSFVARTVFSRRPPPWANQRPMIDSVEPLPSPRPETPEPEERRWPARRTMAGRQKARGIARRVNCRRESQHRAGELRCAEGGEVVAGYLHDPRGWQQAGKGAR
jgi:hypothetical protein